MNDWFALFARLLLSASLGIFSVPVQAGFFDQMVDSVKQATEDTLKDVINRSGDPQTHRAAPSRDTRQSTVDRSRERKQPTMTTPPPTRPTYDRELVLRIQKRLNVLGIDAGKPDGLYGPGTKRAIQIFQRQQGLAIDGHPSEILLRRLDQAIADRAVEQTAPATTTAVEAREARARRKARVTKETPSAALSTASLSPTPKGVFTRPSCTALAQWAEDHDTKETVALTPKTVISGLFADNRAVAVFGTSPATWSRSNFNQVREWLKECRRSANDKVASSNLYKAYQVTTKTLKPIGDKDRYGPRGYRAVDNLIGYHRSSDLVKALELANQALHGADIRSEIHSISATPSVKGEVVAVQNSRGYLTDSDVEILTARIMEAMDSVRQELAAREAEFEALQRELDQVPLTLEGARTLDRLLKSPVLAKVSRQKSMDFQNAVAKKRQAISLALRQQEARAQQAGSHPQKTTAGTSSADVVARLKDLIVGDKVEDISLKGIRPGISYANAKKYIDSRFGLKAGAGAVLLKEFAPTRRQLHWAKQTEHRDGGVVQLETMKDRIGQVRYFEHFTDEMDVSAAYEWLKERLGKPEKAKFLGTGYVWSWEDDGTNLAIMAANQTALQYRSRHEYRSSLVIRLWSDEYIEFLSEAAERCKELRKKPPKQLSAQERIDLLQGCQN